MPIDKDARYQFRLRRELLDRALEKARREDLMLSQVLRRFLREWVRESTSETDKGKPTGDG